MKKNDAKPKLAVRTVYPDEPAFDQNGNKSFEDQVQERIKQAKQQLKQSIGAAELADTPMDLGASSQKLEELAQKAKEELSQLPKNEYLTDVTLSDIRIDEIAQKAKENMTSTLAASVKQKDTPDRLKLETLAQIAKTKIEEENKLNAEKEKPKQNLENIAQLAKKQVGEEIKSNKLQNSDEKKQKAAARVEEILKKAKEKAKQNKEGLIHSINEDPKSKQKAINPAPPPNHESNANELLNDFQTQEVVNKSEKIKPDENDGIELLQQLLSRAMEENDSEYNNINKLPDQPIIAQNINETPKNSKTKSTGKSTKKLEKRTEKKNSEIDDSIDNLLSEIESITTQNSSSTQKSKVNSKEDQNEKNNALTQLQFALSFDEPTHNDATISVAPTEEKVSVTKPSIKSKSSKKVPVISEQDSNKEQLIPEAVQETDSLATNPKAPIQELDEIASPIVADDMMKELEIATNSHDAISIEPNAEIIHISPNDPLEDSSTSEITSLTDTPSATTEPEINTTKQALSTVPSNIQIQSIQSLTDNEQPLHKENYSITTNSGLLVDIAEPTNEQHPTMTEELNLLYQSQQSLLEQTREELETALSEIEDLTNQIQELKKSNALSHSVNKSISLDELRKEFLNFSHIHLDQFNTRIKKTEEIIESQNNSILALQQFKPNQTGSNNFLQKLNTFLLALITLALLALLYKAYLLQSDDSIIPKPTTPITTESKQPSSPADVQQEEINNTSSINTTNSEADDINKPKPSETKIDPIAKPNSVSSYNINNASTTPSTIESNPLNSSSNSQNNSLAEANSTSENSNSTSLKSPTKNNKNQLKNNRKNTTSYNQDYNYYTEPAPSKPTPTAVPTTNKNTPKKETVYFDED